MTLGSWVVDGDERCEAFAAAAKALLADARNELLDSASSSSSSFGGGAVRRGSAAEARRLDKFDASGMVVPWERFVRRADEELQRLRCVLTTKGCRSFGWK